MKSASPNRMAPWAFSSAASKANTRSTIRISFRFMRRRRSRTCRSAFTPAAVSRQILEMFELCAQSHLRSHSGDAAAGVPRSQSPIRFPEQISRLALRFHRSGGGLGAVFDSHRAPLAQKDKFRFGSSAELFREYRLYVACEADEDIPYHRQIHRRGSSADRLGLSAQRSVARRSVRQRRSTLGEDLSPQLRQKIMIE